MDWVSVKDRMPERSGIYLAVCSGEYGEPAVATRFFDENYPTAFMLDSTVTHWMPMPKLPKNVPELGTEEGG